MPPRPTTRESFTRTAKQSVELRRVHSRSLRSKLLHMSRSHFRAIRWANGGVVAVFASSIRLPPPPPGEEVELQVPPEMIEDAEATVQHIDHTGPPPPNPPRSPSKTIQAKAAQLRVRGPISHPKRYDFSFQLHKYLNLVELASIKSRIYPRFWPVNDKRLPGERNNPVPLVDQLPDAAFWEIGLNPERANEVVTLYMVTNTRTKGDMLRRTQTHPFLIRVLGSLRDPRASPLRLGTRGLYAMIFRRLFHHFCDNGASAGVITQAHLRKLSLIYRTATKFHRGSEAGIYHVESSWLKHRGRGRRAQSDGYIEQMMKSKGMSSPLSESISADEEWPEGWGLGSAPRKVLHEWGTVRQGMFPVWDESSESSTRRSSMSFDNVDW